jgi:hypothetical protein
VPQPPTQPHVGADQYLAEVPVPWLIGTGEPQTPDNRPTESAVYSPERLAYVSKGGQVFQHQFIKWLKDDSDAWILLADFNLSRMPEAKSLAAAKLIVYVQEAHDRAPMQAAAAALQAPFASERAYDFGQLGPIAGTTIVARGNGPGDRFVPPRRYEIDVTRLVRAWTRGAPQHGISLRIVPNRAVDDGWTVRFTPDQDKPVELEIATYADADSSR